MIPAMTETPPDPAAPPAVSPAPQPAPKPLMPKVGAPKLPKEISGPAGPEPTRYGDWERKGRVSDF